MRIVDFRSDTVTHPTPEMYRAMMEAELGDDEYGDDPTLNRLEALAAEMLGKETAVFTPSGTMSNLVAILAHCRRGDEMIVGHRSHIFTDEGGGAATLGGVHVQTIHNDDRGMLDPQEVEEAIRPDNVH
ncbi:MAG: DegT/DnrJ/EryC1/StrS family aminotransferase, partial [Chloroflexi bacterium]|nr:DegT/DnrJ/EryC1/StrS family aminotransferase [Chloroflexota bacterium]